MGLCKDCAYWDRDYYLMGRDEHILGLGQCTRVPLLFDVISHTVDETYGIWGGVRLKDCAQGLKAFVQDASDYRAVLLTVGDFGCIQFESARGQYGMHV